MNWRQDTRPPADAFWGEGLLAVDPIPSIRADLDGPEVAVSADGPVLVTADTKANSIEDALGRWADGYAATAGVDLHEESPAVWCSWYQYFGASTASFTSAAPSRSAARSASCPSACAER